MDAEEDRTAAACGPAGSPVPQCAFDAAAVRDLTALPVEAATKGMPAWTTGRTVRALLAAGSRIADGGFLFPLLTVDRDAVRHNVLSMAKYCEAHDVLLAPHAKTTMAPQLFAQQLAAGAWALSAATVRHVQLYRRFGVQRVLLANELVDPAGLDWVLRELQADPAFDFYAYVDSLDGVRLAADAVRRVRPDSPLQLLVEMGYPGGRAGCRRVADAVDVARAVAGTAGLAVAGVAGFEGLLGDDSASATLRRVRAFLRTLRRAGEAVAAERGDGCPVMLLSAGGSAYFDLVVGELALPEPSGWRVVLRSGSYLAHDDGLYAKISPAVRGPAPAFVPALRLWGRVLSTPEPGLAIVGLGRRDASFDSGLPIPKATWSLGAAAPRPLTGAQVSGLNDEHCYLRCAGVRPEVGALVAFGVSHPCTVFDKWRLIPVVDPDHRIVDCISTFF